MASLLYLVHRMPYPPNKGDKVRSFHLLKHLAEQGHDIHLGTFVDDPDDLQHVPALRRWCASVCAVPLTPRLAKLRSLGALPAGQPLTLQYYADRRLRAWVNRIAVQRKLAATLVFSSSMAQYADQVRGVPMLVDLVDVDSAKWTDYAPQHAWPMSWLYRREGRRLLAYERAVVARASHTFLVTDKEVALFVQLAPEAAGRVAALRNGVDADFFSPDPARASPFAPGELPLVFTGAMDYWPNVDAVTWFVRDMLPVLRSRWPSLRFHIVGRSPTPAVRALAAEGVVVSGTVPDVRPYLQHAAAVVAPLRLARGVQNKVLEAMAMGRPVIAARSCVEAIEVRPGQDLLAADDAPGFVMGLQQLLADANLAASIGRSARMCVLGHHSWSASLGLLDRCLADAISIETRQVALVDGLRTNG